MPLTPAEIEQWLSKLESEFDAILAEARCKFPEHPAFFETMIERQKLLVSDLLAEAIRRGMPITKDRLAYLLKQMAEAMQTPDC